MPLCLSAIVGFLKLGDLTCYLAFECLSEVIRNRELLADEVLIVRVDDASGAIPDLYGAGVTPEAPLPARPIEKGDLLLAEALLEALGREMTTDPEVGHEASGFPSTKENSVGDHVLEAPRQYDADDKHRGGAQDAELRKQAQLSGRGGKRCPNRHNALVIGRSNEELKEGTAWLDPPW